MTPPAARLPDGYRVVLDPRTRRRDGGAALLGGSPLRLLRLAPRARALLTGDELVVTDPTTAALAARLLDTGLAHPALEPVAPADVTVVVPVKDRTAELARLLAALRADLPDVPVLVVDDGSADPVAQAAVCAAHRARVIRHDTARGPSAARNAGLAAATTPAVAFLDSDCVPLPGWLGVLAAHLADPRLAVVAPRVVALPTDRRGWVSGYEDAASALDMGPRPAPVAPLTGVSYVPSAALLVRRAALGAGFDESMRVAEDVDLVWRLAAAGWRVRYDPAAQVAHDHPVATADWLRRRAYYGTGAALLAHRHGAAVAPVVLSPVVGGRLGAGAAGRPAGCPRGGGGARRGHREAGRPAGGPAADGAGRRSGRPRVLVGRAHPGPVGDPAPLAAGRPAAGGAPGPPAGCGGRGGRRRRRLVAAPAGRWACSGSPPAAGWRTWPTARASGAGPSRPAAPGRCCRPGRPAREHRRDATPSRGTPSSGRALALPVQLLRGPSARRRRGAPPSAPPPAPPDRPRPRSRAAHRAAAEPAEARAHPGCLRGARAADHRHVPPGAAHDHRGPRDDVGRGPADPHRHPAGPGPGPARPGPPVGPLRPQAAPDRRHRAARGGLAARAGGAEHRRARRPAGAAGRGDGGRCGDRPGRRARPLHRAGRRDPPLPAVPGDRRGTGAGAHASAGNCCATPRGAGCSWRWRRTACCSCSSSGHRCPRRCPRSGGTAAGCAAPPGPTPPCSGTGCSSGWSASPG